MRRPFSIDEIDTVFGPKAKDNEEVRGWLNAGHARGAMAGRCVMRGKVVETEELPAYCAVALAGLGWLPDTILTRSVIIRMRRRHTDEVVEPFRRRVHSVQGERVRDEIETWAATQPKEVVWPELPSEIQDRNADVWEPLIAVADMAGGKWPAMARAAAVALVAASREVEPSLNIRLLTDTRTVFADHDAMSSKAIVAALQEMDETPWKDLKGKSLDASGLAKRLRQFDIKSKNIRTGAGIAKGYSRADFADAWSRYLPPSPHNSATGATAATVVPFQRDSVADVADGVAASHVKNGNSSNSVASVAPVADLPDDGRGVCHQCGSDADPHLMIRNGSTWLHRQCVRFYVGSA